MSETKNPKSRVDWVDYGKGLSIILVVFHHCIADIDKTTSAFWSPGLYAVDEVFALFRMPLFFVMAGIFAAKALRSPWPEFIDKKVIHFLYLFVLWSFLVYAYTIALPYLALGMRAAKLDMILYIFVEPPRTLWFIYALLLMFLLTRILHRVPLLWLLVAALILYLATLDNSLLLEVDFIYKLVRLYFFFLLGCWLSPWLQRVSGFVRPWHLLLFAVYVGFALFMVHKPEARSVVVVLLCQLVGVAAGIVLAELMSRGRMWGFVRTVGFYSLAVYVMHRIVLFTLDQVVKLVPVLPLQEANILIALLLSLVLPIIAARLIYRYNIHGLLDAPRWMSARRRERGTEPRAEAESSI
jgi:uncharacterized membrane protein YcfT